MRADDHQEGGLGTRRRRCWGRRAKEGGRIDTGVGEGKENWRERKRVLGRKYCLHML